MSQKFRLTELDALRGIAAFIVVVYHFTLGRVSYSSVLKFGTTGVDLFFIISGFVIFLTIEKCTTAKEFMISRFSRLYPAYWACVSITFLSIFVSAYFGFNREQLNNIGVTFLVNLSMFQHYFGIKDIDDQYWTLAVELLFYIFILLLFVLKRLKHIYLIGMGMLIALMLWNVNSTNTNQHSLSKNLLFYIPLLRYFPLFFAGVLFYKMKNGNFNLANSFGIILSYVVQVMVYEQFHRHFWIMNTVEFALSLFVYYSLFFLFITNRLKWVANKYTVFLGEISYSLYLIHNFIGTKIIVPGLMQIGGFPLWLSVAIAIAIVIMLAYVINRFIEKPMMMRIRNHFNPIFNVSKF